MSGLRGFSHRARPLVIGHRGLRRDGLVENTLAAFAAAQDEGAEAIELDVRLCASGEAVVLHDPTLERLTAGADLRAAADLTLAELSRVELPGAGLGPDGAPAHVSSLAEVLAFARERLLPVNIELKRDVPSRTAVVRAVARLLDRWDATHALLVSSFDPVMLAGLGALVPRVPRAILVHRTKWHLAHAGLAVPLGAVAVNLARTLTRPELVRGLKARGLAVNVWTVNDPAEARDLAALGVDALITDAPGEVRAALGG
jgi:glycerophosphoryl diester phosphodiesterase